MIDHTKADDMPSLDREFFSRSVEIVAPDLVGCYLFTTIGGKRTGGMIIESEAYDHNDPFCHCHRNADDFSKTQSKPMFFEPGSVYIYWVGQLASLNFVCNPGSAVLIKALYPTCGDDEMYLGRTALYRDKNERIPSAFENAKTQKRHLCNGQGVLSEASELMKGTRAVQNGTNFICGPV